MPSVRTTVVEAESLHPHIVTTLDNVPIPPPHCVLHVVYQLPPSVFVDPNQLADREASLGPSMVFGETDLEAPLERVADTRGSVVILRNATLATVDLPIHLRYQRPSATEPFRTIAIPPPMAGWSCYDDTHRIAPRYPPIASSLIPKNSAPATLDLFENENTPLTLKVPVGQHADARLVEFGTLACILLCTVWILQAIRKAAQARKRRDAKGKRRKSE